MWINHWYDRQMFLPTVDRVNEFANYGFWEEDTHTETEACENLMEKLLAFLPEKQGTILDVACGKGATTRHLRAAIYLAGYAIECILKAYIISHSPPSRSLEQAVAARRTEGENVPDITGAPGHNLALLLSLTDLEAALDGQRSLKRDWGICLRWRSTWRYDPEPPSSNFAREFVSAVRRVYDWIERQL